MYCIPKLIIKAWNERIPVQSILNSSFLRFQMQKLSSAITASDKYNKSLKTLTLDPGKYFRQKHVVDPFAFDQVERWSNFENVVTRNIERLGKFERPCHFMTTQELALVFVSPLLARLGLNLRFLERRSETFPFIGNADIMLCDSTTEAPLLIGQNHSDLALDFDLLDYLRGNIPSKSDSLEVLEEAAASKQEVVRTMQTLCHIMLVNDLAYGYLSSESSTRFVKITPNSSGLDLRISDPINSHDICSAIVALSLEAYYRHLPLCYYRGFDAYCEAVEDPNIEPLSSFDKGSTGKIKWWIASRVSRHQHIIRIDHRISNGKDGTNMGGLVSEDNSCVWRYGTVTVDGLNMRHSLLKISTNEAAVRHEASILQYLGGKANDYIPQVILFAHILGNDFHVLALEPFGRHIIPEDLLIPGVEDKMIAGIDELHRCGIMLVEIDMNSFAIENAQTYGALPIIRIVSFTSARLYRRIPNVAHEKEMTTLKTIISRAKALAIA